MFDVNDSRAFEEMTEDNQNAVLSWISRNFIMIETFNTKHSSYQLKHSFEADCFYITNGEFKGAMLRSGFSVKNIKDDNWFFNISEKSPAVQRLKLM